MLFWTQKVLSAKVNELCGFFPPTAGGETVNQQQKEHSILSLKEWPCTSRSTCGFTIYIINRVLSPVYLCSYRNHMFSTTLQNITRCLVSAQQKNKPLQAAGFSYWPQQLLTTQLGASAVTTQGGGRFSLGAVSMGHNASPPSSSLVSQRPGNNHRIKAGL